MLLTNLISGSGLEKKDKHAASQRKYVQNNSRMAKLSQSRRNMTIIDRRRSDPEFDAQIRKKEAERKQLQRLRKKSGVRENEMLPEAELNLRVTQDDTDEETREEGHQVRRRFPKRKSGSLENPKPSVLSRIESDGEPSNRQVIQRARGDEVRRKNRKEKNNEIKDLTEKVQEKDLAMNALKAEIEVLRERQVMIMITELYRQ